MDTDLGPGPALENLYRTFARHSIPEDSVACDHCVLPETIHAARTEPLRTLSASTLERYAANAPFGTWGDVRDLKYYLPRVMELLVRGEFDHSYYGEMLMRMLGEHWRDWPQDEQEAVLAVIDAWWRFTLHRPPRAAGDPPDIDIVEMLEIIVEMLGLDLDAYLTKWEESAGNEAAALHVAKHIRLFEHFMDHDKEWQVSLDRWFCGPAPIRIMESALPSASSAEVEEKLRSGLNMHIWGWEDRTSTDVDHR
ncbi:hypothetical protein FHS43_004551 [Streptosporangium becharense]|uniref:Uncharacterized protein n=1 Tax=Streptosporangium becharense TaxID=1816182 RepID=A0A7W9MJ37_9ACTN|nr:hypothetical protein [Streptosporangium becharense]MBB2913253.1 hypothetical protein [Streptosporangium becharense]MBB5822236.1 hypothetical protein [Streptosporangium becharense]